MTDQLELQVRVDGSPELIESLEQIASSNPTTMTVELTGASPEPSRFKFGLAEVATIVAIVKGTVELGKFAKAIFDHLSKERTETVVVQTPIRTIEIGATDAPSETQVAKLLEAATRVA